MATIDFAIDYRSQGPPASLSYTVLSYSTYSAYAAFGLYLLCRVVAWAFAKISAIGRVKRVRVRLM